jgi:hypothetical protein
MKQPQVDAMSRRNALQRGLGAVAGAAIVWLVESSAFAASSKLAKTVVQYTDTGNVQGKDCDDCSQFVAGKTSKDTGTCKLVEGDINPHGHCVAFTPKPKT